MTNKQIENKINELQSEIDKLKKEAEKNSKKKEYIPIKEYEPCKFVDINGRIETSTYVNDVVDNYLISIGNFFPATPEGEKEAEEKKQKDIARATIERWIKENDDVELDWSNSGQPKYSAWYDHRNESLSYDCSYEIQYSEFYVSSRSLVERMLVELEKEFKIYYGIK